MVPRFYSYGGLLSSFIPGGAIWILIGAVAFCAMLLINIHNRRVDAAVLSERREWQIKMADLQTSLAQAQSEMSIAKFEADTRIAENDIARQAELAAAAKQLRELEEKLKNARATVALPRSCDECRIPASRVWQPPRVYDGQGANPRSPARNPSRPSS